MINMCPLVISCALFCLFPPVSLYPRGNSCLFWASWWCNHSLTYIHQNEVDEFRAEQLSYEVAVTIRWELAWQASWGVASVLPNLILPTYFCPTCLVNLTPIYSCSLLLAKVRRLYDIANVLTSLGLIKKVHVTEERGRKPAFKWIGPVEFPKNTGNLGTLHLFSFCFDSPFPSGKRLVSTCKEWLSIQWVLRDY